VTTDGELLAGVRAEEMRALELLYDRYAGYVNAIALRILGDFSEAEEVTQDVFWQVWRMAVRYDPERARFSTWLFTIARSRALDRIRQRSARSRIEHAPSSEPRGGGEDPEEIAFVAERRRFVLEILAELPAPQREALELCFFQGLTHKEAATKTGAPLGTLKTRVKMAIEKLRGRLQGVGSAL